MTSYVKEFFKRLKCISAEETDKNILCLVKKCVDSERKFLKCFRRKRLCEEEVCFRL